MELSSDNLKDLSQKTELAEKMQRTSEKLKSSTATLLIRSEDLRKSDESEARFIPEVEVATDYLNLSEFGKLQQELKIDISDLLKKYSGKFKALVKKQLKAKK